MADVTVVLPVYRGERYLAHSILSVLEQTFSDYELIVIDDGSDDLTERIICSIEDPRLRYFHQSNRGLARTLNIAIGLAGGKYIARQDHDDLMLPGRLTTQVAFLDNNSDYAMVGTWAEIWVGNQPAQRGHYHPASHEALRLELLFDNPFVHSSVMMRTEAVRSLGSYCEDKKRQPPEDYELWSRISRKYRVANIPEVLTVYREVKGSMSRAGGSPLLSNVIQISSENLAAVVSPEFSLDQCFALASLYHGRFHKTQNNVLSRTRALQMHQRAAAVIGGEVATWTEEFSASFRRQHEQIKSQLIRRYLPSALIGPARGIKRYLADRTKSFPYYS